MSVGKAKGSEFVAVSFDSLTCPVWRAFAGADLHKAFSGYDVPVLHVYTKEAHADNEFAAHVPAPLDLAEPVNVHKTWQERAVAAKKAKALLEAKTGERINMVMDAMGDGLEKSYEARPWRLYVVEVATGNVAYAMGPSPFNFGAKMSDVTTFLKEKRGGLPWSFFFMRLMHFVHGFVLDLVVIGLLPFLNPKASDAERVDKFPWAKGGYPGFEEVPNLAPCHRRFMSENAAYAVMRLSPFFLYKSTAVLTLACLSYVVEALTIMWELTTYNAPARSMLPATLMAVFCTVTTLTVMCNVGDTIPDVEPGLVSVMQVCCCLTWACWLVSANHVHKSA